MSVGSRAGSKSIYERSFFLSHCLDDLHCLDTTVLTIYTVWTPQS